MEAYGILTGVGGDAFYEAVEAEQDDVGGNRGPFGEQWDVRSEAEAAHKLPRLSAMFPWGRWPGRGDSVRNQVSVSARVSTDRRCHSWLQPSEQ